MQGIEIEYADVLGFPGYRVGTDGSVWSSRRRAVAGATVWIKMAPHPRRDDRLRVYLRRDGRRFLRAVHRLVLESFVGPRPDGKECCHNNGDHRDNRLLNLRWDTPAANALDKIRHGTTARGEENYGAKFSDDLVANIRAMVRAGARQCDLARQLGVRRTTINDIVRGRSWLPAGVLRPSKGPHKRKLTEAQVGEIKRLLLEGAGYTELASRFGVKPGAIWFIATGKTWKRVQPASADTIAGGRR